MPGSENQAIATPGSEPADQRADAHQRRLLRQEREAEDAGGRREHRHGDDRKVGLAGYGFDVLRRHLL